MPDCRAVLIQIVARQAALICTACPVWAQKYKTEIPPAIVTPNTLETRLGTLYIRRTGTPTIIRLGAVRSV